MERFGKRQEQRNQIADKPENLPFFDERQEEARTGLAERFAQTKGRIAAALLSAGISIPEIPPAHAIEPVPTEQSEQIVAETLTPSVVEKIREQGFDARVTLPLPESTSRPSYYIVHMGQMHEATFQGFDRMRLQASVDAYQKKMYSIYPSLVAACNSPIFREGRIWDELVDRNLIEQQNTQISDMVLVLTDTPLNSVEDALTLVTKMTKTEVTPENFRTHPRAQELTDAFMTAVKNLNHFRQSIPEEAKNATQYDEFDFLLRALELNNLSNVVGGTQPQFKASSRLFYEDKVDLFGAEDLDTNQRAIALFEKSQAAESRIKELTEEARIRFPSTPDGEERERIKQEIRTKETLTQEEADAISPRFFALIEAEKQFIRDSVESSPEYQTLVSTIAEAEHNVHDLRETVVYEKADTFLKKYPDYGGNGMKCAVVEYGHDHTFAESAEAWNARPDVKVSFGVIEIHDPNMEKSGK